MLRHSKQITYKSLGTAQPDHQELQPQKGQNPQSPAGLCHGTQSPQERNQGEESSRHPAWRRDVLYIPFLLETYFSNFHHELGCIQAFWDKTANASVREVTGSEASSAFSNCV